jgi:hypothetical protein
MTKRQRLRKAVLERQSFRWQHQAMANDDFRVNVFGRPKMDEFSVWVRPLGHEYLVCVDGIENAKWLLSRLSRSFIFRSAEPIRDEYGSSLCTFHVPHDGRLPISQFNRVLSDIPEVSLVAKEQSS